MQVFATQLAEATGDQHRVGLLQTNLRIESTLSSLVVDDKTWNIPYFVSMRVLIDSSSTGCFSVRKPHNINHDIVLKSVAKLQVHRKVQSAQNTGRRRIPIQLLNVLWSKINLTRVKRIFEIVETWCIIDPVFLSMSYAILLLFT